ncbi:hypothetical protein ASD64_02865 [Mesorhizobium sp. Root157]|uniref:O-antigen ligase family protein n=1 Tax=Mesorhizobium sp. Root157 TaxID=1736477 RepID=UPI000700207B|nr:O-antigen ligase family protein [Mesorhizobium sp. Root157]KQZ93866.1 hypothetical protein ASD64_02865 [Mesorhizobium sp. Root157]
MGSISLSAYRIVLLFTVLPCLVKWLSGQAGRVRVADIGLLLFSLWTAISLAHAHGISAALQSSGIIFVETAGAYFLARCYIRDANDFRNMIGLVAKIVILLAPFSLYEWITASKPILAFFQTVLPTVPANLDQPRLGFWRVQGPFSHSIEFGLFCGSILALVFLVLSREQTGRRRWILTLVVFWSALMSMSSAPIAALMVQIFLIAWDWVLRRQSQRWILLGIAAFAAYLVVELGSNQTPIQFYISRFTFDAQSGWWRLAIWEYGTASVYNHPMFGIGFADWARPSWMTSDSIDNFWLANTIRYGLPALFFIAVSCLSLTFAVGLKKGLDERHATYRLAYLACMTTFFFVGSTVHFWGATYVWFVFLLGSGAWFLDIQTDRSAHTGRRARLPSDRTSRRNASGTKQNGRGQS